MSNGTITKVGNTASGLGTIVTQPTLDLLTAMGHGNGSGATEEFVTMPGMSNTINAANYDGATNAAKINAAIADAVVKGKSICFVPQSLMPYDASAVTFDSSIQMIREGGRADVLDVRAYGADPTGTANTYARVGIQAALDAAAAAATIGGIRTVYFPPGRYELDRFVRVSGNGISLIGLDEGYDTERQTTYGYGAAVLSSSSFYGPLVVVENSDITFPHLVAGLTSSGGSAIDFSTTGRDKISLHDLRQASFNGATQFCFQVFWKNPVVPTDYVSIVSSSVSDVISSTAFYLREAFPVAGAAVATFSLTLSGGTVTVTGTTDIADGAGHYLEANYDGTTVRLFVDGVLDASAAGTGTVVQSPLEIVNLGASNRHFAEHDFVFSAGGIQDSPHFSSVARHTVNYTPPTAKHSRDAQTLMLLNFDEQDGRFTKVSTASSTAVGWARHVADAGYTSSAGANGAKFDGLHFVSGTYNTGILLGGQAGFASIRRCNFGNLRHVINGPHGNHFNWRVSECFVTAGSESVTGVSMGINSPDGHVETIWFFGVQVPFVLAVGAVTIDNMHWITSTGNRNYAALAYGAFDQINGVVTLRNSTVDLESGVDTTYQSALLLQGGGAGAGARVEASVFQTRNGKPLATINGAGSWMFTQCDYQWFDATTPTSVIAATGAVVAKFEQFQSPTAWIPLSDTAGTATLARIGKGAAVAYAASPSFVCSTRDAFELDASLSGDLTPTFSNLTPGQEIELLVVQDGSGGHNVTFGAEVNASTAVDTTASHWSQWTWRVGLDGTLYQKSFASGA